MIQDEIKSVEEEIHKTKKNKATERHLAMLYCKLGKLRDEAEKKTRGGGKGKGYTVKKSGDATATLVGFPSVGKSTLINALTNADSEVAAYDFTTLTAIPGIMKYKQASFQIVDLPGIISDASVGRGKGKEVLSVVRNADLVIIMLDAKKLHHYNIITKELHDAGIRLDSKPPEIMFKNSMKGGIKVSVTVKLTHLSIEMVKEMLRNYGFINGEVIIRKNVIPEEFIDALLGSRHYVPSLTIINKIDNLSSEELGRVRRKFPNAVLISAEKEWGLDELREQIFRKTKLIRIYLKPHGKPADMNEPLIMHEGITVRDLGVKIHKDFVKNFRYAQVWGKSARFPGQKLGINHELKDEDIVTIVI
ncbi:GTP-binding protein [archaeon CG07_land_8_20_14_0_80_38_8]|nr:MAG: GTP-binding protein [archaeon CG07_land_8_20_14_0_80_38_8]PIU89237.1 MAG: GTP-binding protein [archaeon CG06_land_8_20_14_3_00_37_11]